MTEVAKTGQSRVFTIEDRAGPAHAPAFQGLARAGSVSWPQGDITPVRVPSTEAYNEFIVVDEIVGVQGFPSMPVEFRKTLELSEVLKLIRKRCALDVQVHVGACQNPSDFNGGWDVVIVLENARGTDYGTGDLGALDADQQAPVIETVPFTGRDYYEVKKVRGSELGAAEIVQEVVAVAICDSRSCGTCGSASDGCQKVFALTLTVGVSPGLAAELIYSSDGGATLGQTNIDTLAGNQDPNDMACVGPYLCVVSEDSESLHYALTADVLDGTESWSEVTTGFVAAKGPLAIFSLGQTFTWIVGEAGYIYFSDDITAGVTVQDAGVQSIQNLNDIHGFDNLNLVAVGASNAVVVTANGGDTWTAVTGPDVGVVLNTVWMKSKLEWFVGTAGGKLWYTSDGGGTWTQKRFSNDGAGVVRKVFFSTPTIGWMSHDYTPAGGVTGRILRTIDGGFSWYVIPEERGLSLPTNDRINDLVGCGSDPNLIFGGGLNANGTDGILVKAA